MKQLINLLVCLEGTCVHQYNYNFVLSVYLSRQQYVLFSFFITRRVKHIRTLQQTNLEGFSLKSAKILVFNVFPLTIVNKINVYHLYLWLDLEVMFVLA